MASLQCVKPSSETCHQKCSENSLGQQVSKMTTSVAEEVLHHGSQSHARGKPQAAGETLSKSKTLRKEEGVAKAQAPGKSLAAHTKGHHGENHASNGEGKAKKKEKKHLLHKVKHGGGSSNDSSSSSSESDSDNDTRGKKKASSVIILLFAVSFMRIVFKKKFPICLSIRKLFISFFSV
jgi:hypothetical protein